MVSQRSPTFRVDNLPPTISEQALKDILSGSLCSSENGITVEAAVVPSCAIRSEGGYEEKSALVSFRPQPPRYIQQQLSQSPGVDEISLEVPLGTLAISKSFYGLTQLYNTAPGRPIQADIVAVTGLNGHAYGSWRAPAPSSQVWLRDFFSADLPRCRTMVYGYNTNLRHPGIHTIADYKIDLLEQLKKARATEEEKRRPLIFIGHSFGGVIVTQALVKAEEALSWDNDPETHAIYQSTRALFFFGTPHRGLPVSDILTAVDVDSCQERADLVRSLEVGSPELNTQLQKFLHFAEEFKIFSFYERQKTRKLVASDGRPSRNGEYFVPVGTDSAVLNVLWLDETCIPVDGNHSTMVKFASRADRTYQTVLTYIRKSL